MDSFEVFYENLFHQSFSSESCFPNTESTPSCSRNKKIKKIYKSVHKHSQFHEGRDGVLVNAGVLSKFHGVGKRARTFPPDAEDTLWRHISKTCGATLFGATLFGDAAFSCDATYWRCIVWRHIVWWRHIVLWRHILAPHCWRHILAPHSLATHCLVTPHWGVLRCIGGLEAGWNGLGWGLVVWAKMHPVRGVFLGAW